MQQQLVSILLVEMSVVNAMASANAHNYAMMLRFEAPCFLLAVCG